MTSYDVVSGDKSVLAARINSTQTTGIMIAAMNINGSTVAWGQTTTGVIEISEEVEGTMKREWISYTGTTVSSSVTTLTGVSRDVARDASTLTGSGTGQSFNKGAVVKLVDFHYLFNQKADVDRANTWTATQTFGTAGKINFSGTDTAGIELKQLTTTQRDAIVSPANGALIYNTSTGVNNQYIGGVWSTFATGTVSNAADGSSGKVDIATAAEVAAGTATDASSGAINVIPVAIVKPTSTGAVSGSVPCLGTDSLIDITLGGTKKASFTAYAPIFGGATTTGALQSGTAGSAGQVLVSNGTSSLPTFQASPGYSKPVLLSATSSGNAASYHSTTAVVVLDTNNYTIPANDLIAGVAYELEAAGGFLWVSGSINFYVRLGTTNFTLMGTTPTSSPGKWFLKTTIFGTAAAGGSVTVASQSTVTISTGTVIATADNSTAAVATNGTLVFQLAGNFSGSNSGHELTCTSMSIKKISTTAF